jgi:acetyl-CoA carboxylase/biotin carboxylase 1
VKSEKPDIILSVLSASVHIAEKKFEKNFANFRTSLERGQILPYQSLVVSTDVDLIHENQQYKLGVTKCAASAYMITMNGSYVEVEAHRLNDGALLMNYDAHMYVTYMMEEVTSYRVIIGIQTMVFQKENDPSLLRSPSAGKLIQFLVDDECHVDAGQVYAEIEVMKMVMELRTNVAGTVSHVKRAGAVLDVGMVLAKLTVDDASLIQQIKPYEGQLPKLQGPKVKSNKLNQIFHATKELLNNVMAGYSYPEPYFKVFEFFDIGIFFLSFFLKFV